MKVMDIMEIMDTMDIMDIRDIMIITAWLAMAGVFLALFYFSHQNLRFFSFIFVHPVGLISFFCTLVMLNKNQVRPGIRPSY